ncbi:MAG: hypothetical protein KAQ91_09970 [Methylococcales bacterium]|nr:hypothetical protein [Methylococcales bacterium]
MSITTKKLESIEAETKQEQRILASNAWHLVRYVMEHDHEIEIPAKFNIGQFVEWSENYPDLNTEDKINFINQYAMLEKITKKVTARTLVATRIHGRGFFHAAFCTSVGQYLLFLSIITFIFVYLLIVNITGKITILMPFYAAGLGTCVFLLRVTQEKLKTREFDPAFIPSQLIRLSLGVLAGGSIVLFPELLVKPAEKISGADADNDITIGQGSLAFILGYAVDIFYAILDNIGGKIKNREK